MEINYTKEETIKLLEEYYKRLEGRDVKVKISAKKGCIGLYEQEACITTITVHEQVEVGPMMKEVKYTLSENELERNLRALFETYEFKLNSVTLNDGLNSSYEGYGMMEHKVSSAYFKGITLNVDKLKEKGLKKV